uniref:Origin recognition complex subunit 4 C-terminal domain-containing protein n=1 Tax=Aureoumbra lagunensis TaxID=44058 RepID=A0A7S3JTK8_9STRA
MISASTIASVRGKVLERLLSENESNLSNPRSAKCQRVGLFGLEKQENELYERLKRSIEHCESTSIICIGQHGSGKHATVRRVVERLENEVSKYDIVELDGVLHNDATSGVRESVRQLCVQERNISSRYVEDLNILTDALRRRRAEESAPLLVVLSQLELFASRDRQTLLYTLLDAIQLPDSCVVVLGLATDASVLQLFEKRVRSRLNNHQIHFYHPTEQNIIQALDDRILKSTTEDTDEYNSYYKQFTNSWENQVKTSSQFQLALARAVALGRPFRWHTRVAAHAIAALSPVRPVLTPVIWQQALIAQEPMSSHHWISAIAALPPPQLALFLAYLRYERDNRQHYTLNDASNELNKLATRNPTVTHFPDPILLRAHANLLASTIIIFIDTSRAASTALEPSTLHHAKIRLSGAICLEDIWTALHNDQINTPTSLRQWTLQGDVVPN